MQRVVSHRDTAVLHLLGRAGRRGSGGGGGWGSRPHAYECQPASDMHHVGYGLTGAGCAVSPPLV